MKRIGAYVLSLWWCCTVFAGEIDQCTTVIPATPNYWKTFTLSEIRLLPGSPFYHAMQVSRQYLLGVDVNRMLNAMRKKAGLEPLGDYPGSNQPGGTRPGDLWHYLSGISLMYAQTGDNHFRERADYIVETYKTCFDRLPPAEGLSRSGIDTGMEELLKGRLVLDQPDEAGYPWGGTTGNHFYGIHKLMAGLRDAYLYCNNPAALEVLVEYADPLVEFVLRVNPDLFDDYLDIEHGGMNEVMADLYAITGNQKYMEASMKFNHQKVILNIAAHNDVLFGRHANMQIPTFAGTARQYQLTGNEICKNATRNFLEIVYHDHTSCIGGNGCYERFGRPGEISKRLGYTSNETCNTYNMLKVALNYFRSTGELRHMDYFEKALYNHILASQDPESGGVTYYTSLIPGGCKSYSKGYNLEGVWCCVGTGMENHSKYGEAIYFNNGKDLFVNLFIPSKLDWKEKGLQLKMETDFPAGDIVNLSIEENTSFSKQIYIRYPSWVKRPVRIWINDKQQPVNEKAGDYIRLDHPWKKGDRIKIEIPRDFYLEPTPDDPNFAAIFFGPLVLAGELGTAGMPESDLIEFSLKNNRWIPPTDDIPLLIVDKSNPAKWIKQVAPSRFQIQITGKDKDKNKSLSLIPYYQMHHQRYNLYWKMFTPGEFDLRKQVVSDELNPANPQDEKAHEYKGQNDTLTHQRDYRGFWEFNRSGRMAGSGGWFAYDLRLNQDQFPVYLAVTYWGSAPEDRIFDILIDGNVLATEKLHSKYPLTFYEEIYELPDAWVEGKKEITVEFRSAPGRKTGAIYGVKITSNPDMFPNYLFY